MHGMAGGSPVSTSRTLIVCPDVDRFPMTDDDRHRAESAGFRLHEMPGRDLSTLHAVAPQTVASLVWGGWYGEEFFASLPHLKVLARCGAGADNIDIDAAERRGVVVTFVPGASDDEVAEHALALLLACFRRIMPSDRAIRRGEWPSSADLHPMQRVSGSKLGLIGFGRISSAVARKAKALGMDVTSFDPFVQEQAFISHGVHRADTLDDLLRTSDAVSLHMPAPVDQQVVIGDRELAEMKHGAILINTSRGRLVDEDALAQALDSGRLAGAGLDVFNVEPLPADNPLLRSPNVVLTPHSAAFSVQALSEIRRRALSDAIAVLQGQQPRNPLTSTGKV